MTTTTTTSTTAEPTYTRAVCESLPQLQCGPECEWIFERIRVVPLIRGGTIIEWNVNPRFLDPEPHTFQVQMALSSSPDTDDWFDVGDPSVGGFFAVDDTKRVYGKFQWTHYRVVLTTSEGSYASKPQHALGNLAKPDYLKMRELIRMETVRLQQKAGQDGYLLKRRLTGEECTLCRDHMTKEVRDPNCTNCYGTGFTQGYYPPYPCFYVEQTQTAHRSHLDANKRTTDDMPVIAGRMLNIPQVFSYDVWVDRDTDFRWIIHSIKPEAEVRGVPVILYPVEMRLAPYSHPVYNISIEGQQF